ncbi:DciA family protein [Streptomyces lavendulae]|uniref:DciA family protein n=1 Tax=Streptomyces lavendulae TaxID=1914 RepID=UPI0036A14E94
MSSAAGRDPQELGAVVRSVLAERAGDTVRAADIVVDRWPALVPQLARHVRAVGFDTADGRLDLRPDSPAYAVQLRMMTEALVQRINGALGALVVRTVRILDPGGTPPPDGPVRPTEPDRPRSPSPGYSEAMAAHRAVRPDRGGEDLAVRAARERQIREQMREPQDGRPHGHGRGRDSPGQRFERVAPQRVAPVSSPEVFPPPTKPMP